MAYISESSNSPLKPLNWYKNLTSKRGRIDAGAFLIEGNKAIRQIAENHPSEVIEIITAESPVIDFGNHPVRVVTEKQFNSISHVKTPQGMMAVLHLSEAIYTDELPETIGSKVLLLENIQDPGNVGTILRTAVAFGFDGVILTEKCADPLSPKCVQSTAGSVLSLWIRITNNYLKLAGELKQRDYSLVVADVNGTDDVRSLSSDNRLVLSLCNESSGPSKVLTNMADHIVGIPIDRPKAESLNVAVCGAICMYLSATRLEDSATDL
ncbi:TrmH family RNA methyltransferase [Chloroflexota bacterium]